MNKEVSNIKLVGEATPEQIEKWKAKHGVVNELKTSQSICYIKCPDRLTVRATLNKDAITRTEILLENCWLGGDESIKTDDAKFYGAMLATEELVEIEAVTLKKL